MKMKTYTNQLSEEFNKNLESSGSSAMTNPNFFEKWNLTEYGSDEFKKQDSKFNDVVENRKKERNTNRKLKTK